MPKHNYLSPIVASTAGIETHIEFSGPQSIRDAIRQLRKIGHGMIRVKAEISNSFAEYHRVEVMISLAETEGRSDDEIWDHIDKIVDEERKRLPKPTDAWSVDEPFPRH